LDNLPTFLQLLSYAIPLRYFLRIIRVLLLKGVGLESIRGDLIAMVLFGIAIIALAIKQQPIKKICQFKGILPLPHG